MTYALLSAAGAAIFGALLTEHFRAVAVRRGIHDEPNERSSHAVPTPRGGGVSIVLLVIVSSATLAALKLDPWASVLAGGGFVVALVGWFDDVGGVRASRRLAVHALAAGLVVIILRDQLVLWIAPGLVIKGVVAWVLVVPFVIWSINSYNFMDGIDGIAGGQCVSVCFAAAGLAYWTDAPVALTTTLLVLAGSSCGFLVHNWHPAKVFMGDVSSGFLGYALAVVTLWATVSGAIPLLAMFVLMGCFHVDSTYTLCRRLLAKERVSEAHRDHAYQHAVQAGHSHATVTKAYLAINVLWLTPWAATICLHPSWGPVCACVALAPLLVGAIMQRAGVRPTTS